VIKRSQSANSNFDAEVAPPIGATGPGRVAAGAARVQAVVSRVVSTVTRAGSPKVLSKDVTSALTALTSAPSSHSPRDRKRARQGGIWETELINVLGGSWRRALLKAGSVSVDQAGQTGDAVVEEGSAIKAASAHATGTAASSSAAPPHQATSVSVSAGDLWECGAILGLQSHTELNLAASLGP